MTLDCPRCNPGKLEEIEIGGVLIDRCVCCAGLWFDNAEIGELVGRRGPIRALESVIPPVDEAEHNLVCPRCTDVALRQLELESGRRVFRCASCAGTWIDRGELRAQEDPGLPEALRRYFEVVKPGE